MGIAQKRAQAYVEAHPNLAPITAAAIKSNTLLQGMTKEQVIAAWGEPNDDTAFALLEGAINPQGFAYFDPKAPQAITSVADMAAMLASFPPGASATVLGEVDLTKAYARATVKFDFGGQGMVGQYFFDLDEDNLILRAVGFPGPGGQ